MLVTPDAALEVAERWDSIANIGGGSCPVLAVDLRGIGRSFCVDDRDRRLAAALAAAPWVNIAVVGRDLDVTFAPLADAFDVLVGDGSGANAVVDVDAVDPEVDRLIDAVERSPQAAVSLVQLLRQSETMPVRQALHAESLTYAVLQSGETFRRWLAGRPPPSAPSHLSPPVRIERDGSLLRVTLDRAERRNALDVTMRDLLLEAFELLLADDSLDGALWTGAGESFCAGGDLAEFGTTPSAAMGHHVRTIRSVGDLLHRCAPRVRVELHGACVGAGIELPAFVHSVVARTGTTFRLPEVGFGLVPGAGGTVSIARRCGRHRTAWLALTGEAIDAETALGWGLVDRIERDNLAGGG